MSSWMRTGETTMPSSAAIWRRMTPTRASSEPPAPSSTIGTRPKPIASSSGSICSAPSAASVGAGSSATGCSASSASAGLPRRPSASGPPSRIIQPIAAKIPPMRMKGSFGSPGTSANRQITTPATSGALRWRKTWPAMSLPRSRSEAERVTMMPVATEMSSAGICAARPSPTVSSEKCCAAAGAVRHDDELDDDEHEEDHEADDHVAADDEVAERLDDVAGVAVQEDQARHRDVDRQTEERGEEQQAREGAELERLVEVHGRNHDRERRRDVQRDEHVEQERRERDDHHHDHEDDGPRGEQVGVLGDLLQG